MSTQSGCNEGFAMLDDFVCEATPPPGGPITSTAASGVNEGIRVSDSRSQSSLSASSKLKVEDLQTLSATQLYTLVRSNSELSLEELRTIYDVIADRLRQSKHPVSEGARASLRESILVLLNE